MKKFVTFGNIWLVAMLVAILAKWLSVALVLMVIAVAYGAATVRFPKP